MKYSEPKVLVVDGDKDNRELTCFYLKSAGYECETAEDGQKALEKLLRRGYAAVITSVFLEGIDGITLCKKVRSYSATPVIIFTGAAKEDERSKGFEAGAQAYLVKPYDVENLVPTVNRLIRAMNDPDSLTSPRPDNEQQFRSSSR